MRARATSCKPSLQKRNDDKPLLLDDVVEPGKNRRWVSQYPALSTGSSITVAPGRAAPLLGTFGSLDPVVPISLSSSWRDGVQLVNGFCFRRLEQWNSRTTIFYPRGVLAAENELGNSFGRSNLPQVELESSFVLKSIMEVVARFSVRKRFLLKTEYTAPSWGLEILPIVFMFDKEIQFEVGESMRFALAFGLSQIRILFT